MSPFDETHLWDHTGMVVVNLNVLGKLLADAGYLIGAASTLDGQAEKVTEWQAAADELLASARPLADWMPQTGSSVTFVAVES